MWASVMMEAVSSGNDQADKVASYMLHATPASLTSYPITFPSGAIPPSISTSVTGSPQILRSSSPAPTSNRPEAALRRTGSLASLRSTASTHTSHPESKAEKGFAKFLAARRADWQGGAGQVEEREEQADVRLGIGEGVEVERDGYGCWKAIVVKGKDGLGVGDDTVDVSRSCLDGCGLMSRYSSRMGRD
jgi:hypothetical protein